MMRANLRMATGFALVYAACAAIGLGALFAWAGFSDLAFSLALVLAVALIPVTAILVTLGAGVVRRRALRIGQADADMPSAVRDPIDFSFASWNGIDSRAAVAQLSRHLDTLGIAHRYERGGIWVNDPEMTWHVGPVVGELRIAGWVEGGDDAQREMVGAAVAEFLRDELGIQLDRAA